MDESNNSLLGYHGHGGGGSNSSSNVGNGSGSGVGAGGGINTSSTLAATTTSAEPQSALTLRLAKVCDEVVAELETERAALADAQAALLRDKEAWAAFATHLDDVNRAFSEKVTLNVGGQLFVTTVSTLRRVHDSFFAQMFSGRWMIPGGSSSSNNNSQHSGGESSHSSSSASSAMPSSSEIFIDRDPTMFRHILNFMRGITPDVSLFTPLEQNALKAEAGYYMLTELEQQLEVLEEVEIFTELSNGATCSSLYPHIVDVTLSSSGGNRSFGDVLDTRNTRALENRYHDPETPWLCFSFSTVKVKPTRYSVRQDEDHFIRNWTLQGSNDGNTWINLKEHTNDETISNRSRTGVFVIPQDNGYFARLRILLTGPSHKGDRNFDICNVQFWGYIEEPLFGRSRKRARTLRDDSATSAGTAASTTPSSAAAGTTTTTTTTSGGGSGPVLTSPTSPVYDPTSRRFRNPRTP